MSTSTQLCDDNIRYVFLLNSPQVINKFGGEKEIKSDSRAQGILVIDLQSKINRWAEYLQTRGGETCTRLLPAPWKADAAKSRRSECNHASPRFMTDAASTLNPARSLTDGDQREMIVFFFLHIFLLLLNDSFPVLVSSSSSPFFTHFLFL